MQIDSIGSTSSVTGIAQVQVGGGGIKVPFVDILSANRSVSKEVTRAIDRVIQAGSFVLGPQVIQFEEAYAQFCAVAHCIGVGNGTDAIELAVRASGIGAGDEVIIPANTFVATAEGVQRSGAKVIIADCNEDFLLDPGSVAELLTANTRAVIAVDLYGQPAQFDELQAILPDSVNVIEDAAQSQGASHLGKPAGSFGVAAATSFYPGKNLGAYGDGGAVMTNSQAVATKVRQLRNHGGIQRYEHSLVGTNSRLDSIQAAVLSVKLARLHDWNSERTIAAMRYEELLGGIPGVVLPRALPGNRHVWHLYVVRVQNRDDLKKQLESAGIGVGIHYPTPVHLLPAFTHLGYEVGDFPVAEKLAAEILSLPMFPGITVDQQGRVAEVLRSVVQS